MNNDEIIKKVNGIFVEVFNKPDIVINEKTTAKDVKEWDSLAHIQLVISLEKKFAIKFTAKEIRMWKSVGDIINSIKIRIP